MNTKFLILLFCIASCLSWIACDHDSDEHYLPNQTITKALTEKYPEALRISWKNKHGYEVADFYLGNEEKEAWFDPQGNWVLTETELSFSAVPNIIKKQLAEGPYAQWKIKDDVDKIERPQTTTLYIIEVEKGKQEIDLHYTESGILVKEVPDNNPDDPYLPSLIPDALKNQLAALYPDALFLEYDVDKDEVEVDILDGNIHKEVVFTSAYDWLYTEWEIHIADIPTTLLQVFQASAYADYAIDEVHLYEKPTGVFYQFELEKGEQEINITFTEEGILI